MSFKRLSPMVGEDDLLVEDPEAEQARAEADFWVRFPNGLKPLSTPGSAQVASVRDTEEDSDGEV